MSYLKKLNFSRKKFNTDEPIIKIPNLIDLQRSSYQEFLQRFEKNRENKGLNKLFNNLFPIGGNLDTDIKNKNLSINFVNYHLGISKYSSDECKNLGLSFSVPLAVEVSIKGSFYGDKNNKYELDRFLVSLGQIPLLTKKGTFIINGVEKTIVTQLRRSPSLFFTSNDVLKSKGVTLIPNIGPWIEIEFSNNNGYGLNINKTKNIDLLLFYQQLGINKFDLLESLFGNTTYSKCKYTNKWFLNINFKTLKNTTVISSVSGDDLTTSIYSKKTIIDNKNYKSLLSQKFKHKLLPISYFLNRVISEDIYDPLTNKKLISKGEVLNKNFIELLDKLNIRRIKVIKNKNLSKYLLNLYNQLIDPNPIKPNDDFLSSITYALNSKISNEKNNNLISYFNDPLKYDLSNLGRNKLNSKFGLKVKNNQLNSKDFLSIFNYLINHLESNLVFQENQTLNNLDRIVKPVGQTLENLFFNLLNKADKQLTEKLNKYNVTELHEIKQILIEVFQNKVFKNSIESFFNTSSLSQFLDSTNPLSEMTHKRRMTLLGPQGLTPGTATLMNRDINPLYYGRICPIETPEGENVGLVNSLSVYGKINSNGLIETPYRLIDNGFKSNTVNYIDNLRESNEFVGTLNDNTKFRKVDLSKKSQIKHRHVFNRISRKNLSYIDASSKQITSISAGLIPFLEHDDASRALMGSNMQRQAVPLLFSKKPLIGTGIEKIIARDSESSIIASNKGIVQSLSNDHIISYVSNKNKDLSENITAYQLSKYQRSNQNTLINQKPNVNKGNEFSKYDILANGSGTDQGELALGNDLLVAFMSFNGYNFEDSVVISNRVNQESMYNSLHIEHFDFSESNGHDHYEIFTKDLPLIEPEEVDHLDEFGIIKIGTKVRSGTILCGKIKKYIKPKSTSQSETKLLEAIFKDSLQDATHITNISEKYTKNRKGVVVDVKRYFLNKDNNKLESSVESISKNLVEKYVLVNEQQIKLVNFYFFKLAKNYLIDLGYSHSFLSSISLKRCLSLPEIKSLNLVHKLDSFINKIKELNNSRALTSLKKIKRNISNISVSPSMIRITIAWQHNLKPGDKITGRHGNKGIISKILPVEDMPYLSDGTPVDIILNPIGITSRMNIGQIFETHLGLACVAIGNKISQLISHEVINFNKLRYLLFHVYGWSKEKRIIEKLSDRDLLNLAQTLIKGLPMVTESFKSIPEKSIEKLMKLVGIDKSGQMLLRDGQSGKPFDRKITVGYMHILKLTHFIDDKIHARSTGPYNLMTQQPLGGKNKSGGQRFGEMEVWALQGYGAAYTLQEMLTIKSDSIIGRNSIINQLSNKKQDFNMGIPEAFYVLVRELWSLGLYVELFKNKL